MVQDHLVTSTAIYSAKYRHDANFNGTVDFKDTVTREKCFRDKEHLLLGMFVLLP